MPRLDILFFLADLRLKKYFCVHFSNTEYSTLFIFIRTSNFGAEAERSYFFFLRFEPENVLNMFLKYRLSSTTN